MTWFGVSLCPSLSSCVAVNPRLLSYKEGRQQSDPSLM